MSKRKKKKRTPDRERHCFNCDRCLYICEGDYLCELSNEVVIDDWQPTEHFASCQGKDFKPI